MPVLEYIKIELNCQGFSVKQIAFSPEKDKSIAMLESVRKTTDMKCPTCGGEVHIYDKFDTTLKDMPIYPDVPLALFCCGYRYSFVKYEKYLSYSFLSTERVKSLRSLYFTSIV